MTARSMPWLAGALVGALVGALGAWLALRYPTVFRSPAGAIAADPVFPPAIDRERDEANRS